MYELRKFYENLFASKNLNLNAKEFQNLLITPGIPTLSDDDKEQCKGDITLAECSKALSSMNVGKILGSDGLTTDFYKKFWHCIGFTLVEILNYALPNGELSHHNDKR